MGWVNPYGSQVPAFVGWVPEPPLLYVQVRVELAVGRVWDEKFFVQVNQC